MSPALQDGFGLATVAGVPLPALVALAVAVSAALVMAYTRMGIRLLAIGSLRSAATRAGVRVDRFVLVLFAAVGALAGLAGFLDLARFATTTVSGHTLDPLAAAAAAVIGGTAISGGRVSILGAVAGALLAVILQSGLVIVGLPAFYQQITIGLDLDRSGRGAPVAKPAAGVGLIVRPLSVLVVGLVLAIAACGGSGGAADGGGPIRIVGVTGNASDPFWISLHCGAQAAARRAGVELSWSTSTTSDATVLAQNLKTQTLKRPDGVVVAPFASSAFVSPVRRLMRDGVPVAVVGGADLDRPRALPGVPDLPSDQLHVTGRADGARRCAVPESSGSSGGFPGWISRRCASIRSSPRWPRRTLRWSLCRSSTRRSTRPRRRRSSGAWLVAHPDLKAIWAVSGPAAQGAVAAVAAARPDGQVRIYAYDATPYRGGSAQARRDLSAHRPVSASAGGAGGRGARALPAAPKRTGPRARGPAPVRRRRQSRPHAGERRLARGPTLRLPDEVLSEHQLTCRAWPSAPARRRPPEGRHAVKR